MPSIWLAELRPRGAPEGGRRRSRHFWRLVECARDRPRGFLRWLVPMRHRHRCQLRRCLSAISSHDWPAWARGADPGGRSRHPGAHTAAPSSRRPGNRDTSATSTQLPSHRCKRRLDSVVTLLLQFLLAAISLTLHSRLSAPSQDLQTAGKCSVPYNEQPAAESSLSQNRAAR